MPVSNTQSSKGTPSPFVAQSRGVRIVVHNEDCVAGMRERLALQNVIHWIKIEARKVVQPPRCLAA